MFSRDQIFLAAGVVTALVGITATILWTTIAGIVALLLIAILILFLVVLQRRQLGKIQERTLKLLNAHTETKEKPGQQDLSVAVSTKKIVGILQAQQMSLDLLYDHMNRQIENEDSNSRAW